MSELGLFPLNLVLLPGEQAPLHVFEPRYRELIGECLDENEEFGLVLADDDGIREVGTRAGVIEVVEQFEDGRLNVVVEGRERFRLVELTEGRPFATA
jgi:Lon protease-like protein